MPRLGSIRSTSTRLKISLQASSAAQRTPAAAACRASASRSPARASSVARRSMPAKARKGIRHREPLRRRKRIGGAAAEADLPGPGGAGRHRQDGGAVRHHGLVGLARAVPFEQRELGVMQSAALTVAKHAGELEDPPLAGGEQLLGGEFGRGVEIKARAFRGGRHQLGRESMQMSLVAGRYLQDAGLHLDEVARREPGAQRRHDVRSRQQERAPIRMDIGVHQGDGATIQGIPRRIAKIAGESANNQYVAGHERGPHAFAATARAVRPYANRGRSRESHCQLAPQGKYRRSRR